MRFLVACGIERAEGESLRTAETVPGVNPRCSATALSVTTGAFWPGFLVGAMGYFQTSGPWEWAVSRTNDLITNLVSRTVHALVGCRRSVRRRCTPKPALRLKSGCACDHTTKCGRVVMSSRSARCWALLRLLRRTECRGSR